MRTAPRSPVGGVPGLAGARIAITGAAGFVGAHLSALLHASGAEVVGIDREPGTTVTADLLDPAARDEVYAAIHESDGLIHLAGSGSRSDVVGALAVSMGDLRPDVPVVVASCGAVYGSAAARPGGGWRGAREDDPVRPLGAHGRAHVLVERLSIRRRRYGNRVAIVRPFTVAGEGQPETAAIARWIAAAERGDALELPGGPDRVRDVVDVHDVARGLAIAWRDAVDGVVNLGTGAPVRVEEIVDAVAAATGHAVTGVRTPAGSGSPVATCADPARQHEWLGFASGTDLAALVARQVRATRAAAAATA